MSSESDSEVFFDAEENTPVHSKSKNAPEKLENEGFLDWTEPSVSSTAIQFPIKVNDDDLMEVERKAKDNEIRRKKVEERRKQMLNEDEDILEIHSEQSSLASSSVEGIYPKASFNLATKKSESSYNDTTSVISLGQVGSILGEKENYCTKDVDAISVGSKYSTSEVESLKDYGAASHVKSTTCLEPDVVSSTKTESITFPVAPPRRKKRKAPTLPTNLDPLPSPIDPVESLAREFEYSLDLHSATQGQYVVKPQDREQDRAEGPHAEGSVEPVAESEPVCEEVIQPYIVRTRSDSGRPLTDEEILAQVTVRNLDTGEQIPLSLAEEHLPKCLNPLSLHIMRLTSEYVSNTALDKESDEESVDMKKSDPSDIIKNRTRDLKRRFKMEVNKIRTVVDRVTHSRHAEEDGSEEEILSDQKSCVKMKVSSKLKSADKDKALAEFENIKVVQELGGEHSGAVWTMKFSVCGRLLATAGQDREVRIWALKDAYKYFDDMRQKYNAESKSSSSHLDPAAAMEESEKTEEVADNKGPFRSKPFCRYKGHTAELLDITWSKNYFILSSSMDKTVRLWHISHKECLCCFQHIDFVTAIAFHPKDDRYFLSGSLDGKLRLWNIPDKKVTIWNELEGQSKLITAINFCQNGKIIIVGSYDGHCIFYYTEQLRYYTQIHVRSTKGKNAQGRKISGIEAMPGEDKILVTSNDSRIRLYDLRDLCLTCKYRGYVNLSSQIKASFSHDGKYIVSGSENQFIYIWKTSHDYAKFRRDRNDYWMGIKAHNAVVTSAVFAPNPSIVQKQIEREQEEEVSAGAHNYYVMVSADFNGVIKVLLHKTKIETANAS